MWVTMPSASLLLGARTRTVPFTGRSLARPRGHTPASHHAQVPDPSCHPPLLAALAETVPLRGDDKQQAAGRQDDARDYDRALFLSLQDDHFHAHGNPFVDEGSSLRGGADEDEEADHRRGKFIAAVRAAVNGMLGR